MAQHYDDRLHTTCAQVFDATFDYGFFAEREERFEGAHATRLAGGEKNCGYLSHGIVVRFEDLGGLVACIAAPFAYAIDKQSRCCRAAEL